MLRVVLKALKFESKKFNERNTLKGKFFIPYKMHEGILIRKRKIFLFCLYKKEKKLKYRFTIDMSHRK